MLKEVNFLRNFYQADPLYCTAPFIRTDLKFFSQQNKAINFVGRYSSDPEGKAQVVRINRTIVVNLPCRLGSRKEFIAVAFARKEFSVLIF